MGNLLKKVTEKKDSKKKAENIIFFVVVLIVTLIIINTIWSKDKKTNENTNKNEILQEKAFANNQTQKQELEEKLENILSTIKGVGKVSVFVNYSESSSVVAMYDESTTTSTTEEGDSSGGTRNVTETQVQKDVIFSEDSGKKEPVTQKTTMPTIQGAIITAEGGSDVKIKTDIISAVEAVTGLAVNKIQVFEMKR